MQVLVLASGSQYRAELLNRLNIPFSQFSPDVDESPAAGEMPDKLAMRLAQSKATAPGLRDFQTASQSDNSTSSDADAIIIASDQVASVDGQILGKPGNVANAKAQLKLMQSRQVNFYTAVCLCRLGDDAIFTHLDTTTAHLRALNDEEIDRYIAHDNPLDCAGSFKAESMGISLFERLDSSDPTALIGLPMIAVCRGLRQFGMAIP